MFRPCRKEILGSIKHKRCALDAFWQVREGGQPQAWSRCSIDPGELTNKKRERLPSYEQRGIGQNSVSRERNPEVKR